LDISMTSAKPPKRTIWLLKSTTKILPSLISQITCGCEKKLHGNKKSPVGHTGLLSARGGLISRTVKPALSKAEGSAVEWVNNPKSAIGGNHLVSKHTPLGHPMTIHQLPIINFSSFPLPFSKTPTTIQPTEEGAGNLLSMISK